MCNGDPLLTKGWSGLTAEQVVQQSDQCHPDWTAEMHEHYLVEEEGIKPEIAAEVVKRMCS